MPRPPNTILIIIPNLTARFRHNFKPCSFFCSAAFKFPPTTRSDCLCCKCHISPRKMEMELIFILEISQLAPELFCLIASAQRRPERVRKDVSNVLYINTRVLLETEIPLALLACNLQPSQRVCVLESPILVAFWIGGCHWVFQDSLSHQRASRKVEELPGDFFGLEDLAWINLSLPNFQTLGCEPKSACPHGNQF